MFTEAMRVVLSFIMENHLYTFDGQIKLQSKGGPIGLQLTGVLAQLFMVWWDRQFKIKMDENGLRLRMYKRYVDDVNVIVNAPRSGLKFVESEDRVIQDEDIVEQELAIKADKRCMNLVQKIGNSIHPSISLEVDYPSQHVDGKLPILDLKVWVELRQIQSVEEGGSQVNVVLHEFYSKDVASKCVINARSALSWSSKRTIKRMLQRSDPFRKRECNNSNCLVCSTDGKGPCRSTGVTYELVRQRNRNTCELWNRGSKVR